MRRASGAAVPGVVLVVAALLLSACSGVPTSSVPQVISSVNEAPTVAPQPITPPPSDADPRRIVREFLGANVSQDSTHAQARQYLTPEAAAGWKDTTVTVITEPQLGASVDRNNQLTVTASKIGSVTADGQYTPVTGNLNQGTFAFGMSQVDGQWRIASLPQGVGLLVDSGQFQQTYQAVRLYFFNQAESRLVPDVRYFAQSKQTLATVLLEQLISGAQPDLASAVRNEFPGDIANKRATIALGAESGSTVVQLPGISQQNPETIARVAMQLAWTMEPVVNGGTMQLRDGSRTIAVDGQQTFTRGDFSAVDPSPVGVSAPLYYLATDGSLVSSDFERSAAVGGFTVPNVASVAVAGGPDTPGGLRVAAVSASPNRGLRIGTLPGRLQPVAALPDGPLSRPDWSSDGSGEVWLAAGSGLLRIGPTRAVTSVALNFGSSGPRVEQIGAVRFSPDGARVALVMRTRNSAGQATAAVWIGAVARSNTGTRVDGLHQITPDSWQVRDVTWEELTTLMVIGQAGSNGEGRVWVVQDDGSLPLAQSLTNLPPGVPDAVAAAPSALPVVCTNGTLWRLGGNQGWSELNGGGTQVTGSVPVYPV